MPHLDEITFRGLYLHHTVLSPTTMGEMAVDNWPIYDGPGPDAKLQPVRLLVARAQGLHINDGNCRNSFSLVFVNERFKGSTFQVMGLAVEGGELAIVGGTGEFAMATGVLHRRLHERTDDGNVVVELTIHGFCKRLKEPLLFQVSNKSHKIGPWGGNGGSEHDIIEPPKYLKTITIRSGWVVDSLAFTYVDRNGRKRTAGPWGGPGGDLHKIQLVDSEFVKEISGAFGRFEGAIVVTSLRFVTNVRTIGPWLVREIPGTPFSVPVQRGSGIVGFFARAGKYLDAIGVHVNHV